MKRKLLLILSNILVHSSFAFCMIPHINISDSTHIDSVYQSLEKIDLDKYVGKSLDFLLNQLEFKDYKIGYHEEPSLSLGFITISYNPDIALMIYFNKLEHVPRSSKERLWRNDEKIKKEKISQIYLVNYKIKLYPFYIKISKKG
jgi:hypothetical protein